MTVTTLILWQTVIKPKQGKDEFDSEFERITDTKDDAFVPMLETVFLSGICDQIKAQSTIISIKPWKRGSFYAPYCWIS